MIYSEFLSLSKVPSKKIGLLALGNSNFNSGAVKIY